MEKPEIYEFVRKSLASGLEKEKIKQSLIGFGYSQEEINFAFIKVTGQIGGDKLPFQVFSPPSPSPSPPSSPPPSSPPPPPSSLTPLSFAPPSLPLETGQIAEEKQAVKRGFPFLSVSFYNAIFRKERPARTFLLLAILALLASFKISFLFFKTVYPLLGNYQDKARAVLEEAYPAELEVKIKNGLASVNVSEPYFLEISQKTLNNLLPSAEGEKTGTVSKIRLLAIDTKGKAEDFERYQSLALLTETSLVFYDKGEIKIQSLRNIGDLTLNKEYLFSKFNNLVEEGIIGDLLGGIMFIAPVFILIGIFLDICFKNFALSLLMWLIAKIKQAEINFSQIFAYLAAVSFLPRVVFFLLSFFPILDIFTQSFSISAFIILGLAYTFAFS